MTYAIAWASFSCNILSKGKDGELNFTNGVINTKIYTDNLGKK